MSKSTLNLLKKLKKINDEEADEFMQQELFPAEEKMIKDGIPTLKRNSSRPMTPMLKERFMFAGRWEDAFIDSWLSLSEMKKCPSHRATMAKVKSRIKDWDGAIIGDIDLEDLTLFGFDAEKGAETYLVWNKISKEPKVVYYHDQHENEFKDFNAYLKYITA